MPDMEVQFKVKPRGTVDEIRDALNTEAWVKQIEFPGVDGDYIFTVSFMGVTDLWWLHIYANQLAGHVASEDLGSVYLLPPRGARQNESGLVDDG